MDSLESLFLRDANTCTGGKQWYVCTAGDFRGCCSSDPCTTGVCPDDDDASSTTTKSSDTLSLTTAGSVNRFPDVTAKTTATTTLTAATTVSSTSVSASPTASSTSVDTATSETTGVTALSSVLAATRETDSPSSTPTSIPTAASSNRGAMIGGVLGGVAALALFAILIFCCLRRRRKQSKHEKRSTAISWYPYARKSRRAGSEMKGPMSPCDSEENRSMTTSSSVSPSSTENTHPSVLLTPDLALNSSSTHLISHSPRKKPVPTPPLSNELYASVPPRRGFTPELQDTGFYRLRAELASHSQSELINVPVDERRHRHNPIKTRAGPRAWESPALAPIAASPRASPVRENSGNGHSRSHSDGHASSKPTVVTSEGVVLGANLDRYSNGLEIGRSLALERGRTAERGDADHVMSFMQYGGRSEADAVDGLGISGARTLNGDRDGSVDRLRPRPETIIDDIVSEGDVPPAYEAKESPVGPEIKSPSGRMGMSFRGV